MNTDPRLAISCHGLTKAYDPMGTAGKAKTNGTANGVTTNGATANGTTAKAPAAVA